MQKKYSRGKEKTKNQQEKPQKHKKKNDKKEAESRVKPPIIRGGGTREPIKAR